VSVHVGSQEGDGWGGQNADVVDIDSSRGQSSDYGSAQELPRRPRVSAYDGLGTPALLSRISTQDVSGGYGQPKRHLCGDVHIGQTSHTVSSKQSSHQESTPLLD